jgi:hypothetical protein
MQNIDLVIDLTTMGPLVGATHCSSPVFAFADLIRSTEPTTVKHSSIDFLSTNVKLFPALVSPKEIVDAINELIEQGVRK